MRNISANGLAKLAQKYGTEPISICEIDWFASLITSGAPVISAVVTTQSVITWHCPASTCWLLIDGEAITVNPSGDNFYGTLALAAGTYEYTITAQDAQGRGTQHVGTFTIVGEPPIVSKVVTDQDEITWHVSPGVTDSWLLIDGAGFAVYGPHSDPPGANYGAAFSLDPGTYNYTITAKDGQNQTAHHNGTLTVAGTPAPTGPTISDVVALQDEITWHVSDGTTASAIVVSGRNGTAYGPFADPPGANYGATFWTLPNGTHYFTITATDATGTTQYNGSFVISGAPPVISDVVAAQGLITWHVVGAITTDLVVSGKNAVVTGPYPDPPGDNYSGTFDDLLVGTHYYTITASDGVRTSQLSGTLVIAGESTRTYADRDIEQIPGRIIELSDLDNVVNVGDSSSSQEITLTLDDTDSSIKTLMDAYDVHKRPARVYQYFTGLDLADKFLIFSGKINTPIIWNERDRTVTITIVSQLEDKEVGFSAEEGQFPYLPADLVGKAWPLVFGTVLNYPALQINQAVKGTTLTGTGVVSGVSAWNNASSMSDDSDFWKSMHILSVQQHHLISVSTAWDGVDGKKEKKYSDAAEEIRDQKYEAIREHLKQRACEAAKQAQNVQTAQSQGSGDNPIRILGGEDFPQNTAATIRIGSGLYTGRFNGGYFAVQGRSNPDDEGVVATQQAQTPSACVQSPKAQEYCFEDEVPQGCLIDWTDGRTDGVSTTKGSVLMGGGSNNQNQGSTPVARNSWSDAGATVSLYSHEAITYIASIVPGSVLAVKAYKQLTGERRLTNVPSDMYTVSTQTYGTIIAVQIVLSKPLSSLDDGWSDDIYVTFQSSVGPNTVDIFKYLIQNYTDLTWDAASFDYVRVKLQSFPANFPILDRKNTIQVLQEIAYQARCAIWINNGIFYLKYLPEEPTVVDTIEVSDMDAEGVQVELTSTEDLVTKMKIKWRMSWAAESDRPKDDNEKTIILRHNVTKYGLQEEEYDFYIYNQPDIVFKCATFWLIRKSKTWKRIKFKTFLNKLNLETFDAITLDFTQTYVADGAIKALVEQANYNSAENCVDFVCLVPVTAGKLEQYHFFWPADLPQTDIWPPQDEVDSGSIGNGATGNLPVGDTSTIPNGIFIGGPNVVFGANSSRGDSTPTDVGFTAQAAVSGESYSGLVSSARPTMNLRVLIPRKASPLDPVNLKGGPLVDIRKTMFTDSDHPTQKPAYLDSIIKKLYDDEGKSILVLDGSKMKLCTDDNTEPTIFDFKLDEEADEPIYGAGTAFLKKD